MAGHSKWANIKHRKSAVDAKKGKIFTKIARELQIAAREGGPDPAMNIRLRLVLDKARSANMAKDSIERAIARGAGLEKGEDLEAVTYEGYGPHGVAVMVETLSDNRNRTISELRHVLTKYGGNMASAGSVAWQFDRVGQIVVKIDGQDQDSVFLMAVEAGATDVVFPDAGTAEITTDATDLGAVRDALNATGLHIDRAELTLAPQNEIDLPVEEAMKVMSLIEQIEDLDDVQSVYSNLAFSDELLSQLEAA